MHVNFVCVGVCVGVCVCLCLCKLVGFFQSIFLIEFFPLVFPWYQWAADS